MTEPQDIDATMEDDYDEEADSDFDGSKVADAEANVSASSDEDEATGDTPSRPAKRRKVQAEDLGDLDSGDEVTIQTAKQKLERKKRKGKAIEGADVEELESGWRAKTRSMREREKEERKAGKLANVEGATIDVDALWRRMNESKDGDTDAQPPGNKVGKGDSTGAPQVGVNGSVESKQSKASGEEETITIKRTYDFAGTIHTEVKIVPKSSAEARLYLAQQKGLETATDVADPTSVPQFRRPLRKYSRFDPNINNPEFKQKTWLKVSTVPSKGRDARKVTVLDKTKIDWAAHVDQEGLKEELDVAAKAKEGYLGRVDFLGRLDDRRDEEARQARLMR